MKNSRSDLEKLFLIKREIAIRKSRKDFWTFCKTLYPEYYKSDRTYLKTICYKLQALYEGTLERDGKLITNLMLNVPPRHLKSMTMVNFCKWVLGVKSTNKIIECSYSDDQAQEFSRFTRDGISEPKNFAWEIVYSDIFPDSQLKRGDASVGKWALDGQFFNYIGTGIQGPITGKGCNIAIVDDPIKSELEANNAGHLLKIWKWYTGTFLSRLEEGAIQIIVMTRWSTKDICGLLLKEEPGEWEVVSYEAMKDGEMLCDEILSLKSYEDKKRLMNKPIFDANYHQKPLDIQGLLYQNLKTYSSLPMDEYGNIKAYRSFNYTDTADEGKDYLCSICGIEFMQMFYVTDIYFTQEPQEITEPETADMIQRSGVKECIIESNNGGRAFARNIERILNERGHISTAVTWFHQSQNKIARIRTNAATVRNRILFPENWNDRWPEFFAHISEYSAEVNNNHDDGPDALTGIIEQMDGGGNQIFFV